jgi:hypothetical protein
MIIHYSARTRQAGPSEIMNSRGACVARSEGHACHARRSRVDRRRVFRGRDERIPPKSRPDKQALRQMESVQTNSEGHVYRVRLGGACLSCPPKRNGSSNVAQRTRQARPSEKQT